MHVDRTLRKRRVENGAIDLSQEGAELKFKIDPDTGELKGSYHTLSCGIVSYLVIYCRIIPYRVMLRVRGGGRVGWGGAGCGVVWYGIVYYGMHSGEWNCNDDNDEENT